ncbi:Macrolide export ATP-binding/permease protein MacB [Microbacterium oxydans]|uniref:Macrolide export ATP-binding/permease protein MacB n=1 Tax=Microbacterium oxydans TaxID=82380 RepID=A0A0F0KXS5_9MICO|nr:ABC transporter permease [Microbacterium oxydans]KJL24066.1 Macrolide export ATP-binding/permease protein MacB [Microbacterium oxydans]
MTGFLGALSDAWAEIRVHKLRVLLSLIGIAVSVGALTAVVAISEYQRQFQAEQSDRWGGRAATVVVAVNSDDGTPVDADDFDARFNRVAERFGFSHTARISQGLMLDVQFPDGIVQVQARVMDPAFSQIHRARLLEGRWFVDSDSEAMAPPIVITEPLWDRLGRVPLSQHPTVTLGGPAGGTYQVIGITPRQGMGDEELRVDLLYDSYRARVDSLPADAWTQYEIWMGTGQVDRIAPVLAMDLRAGLPEGQTVSVSRSDWAAQPGALDAQATFEMVTGGIAALILALGALSLINIQLVAMRQRVREIGVRRAFGASSGRVFFAVFLESLVATTVAGVIGIAIVVAVLRSEWIITSLFYGIQDIPPFPMRAALIGLLASVIVGAVSGFIPALVALRVKVIDAIRF